MSNNTNKNSFSNRPVTIVEKKLLTDSLENVSLEHHFFKDVGSNEIKLVNVNFSFSIFDNAYFRDCIFEECIFLGVKFIDSNFHGSKFINCKFQYSFFRSTEISYRELLSNLSPWPNNNRDWLRRLRINFESIGDVNAVKACVKAELFASRDHLRKARAANEGYYAKKYKGFWNQISVHFESLGNFLDWHIWGHGEYPHKLLFSIFLVLFTSSLYVLFDHYQVNGNSDWNTFIALLFQSLRDVSYTFVGVRQSPVEDGLAAFLSISRYVALSLFISVLYKSIARR